MIDIEETSAELITEKKEELHLIDLEAAEIKYVNTQDYLYIDETVVGEPNRAVPDVPTSSDIKQEMTDIEKTSAELIMENKEELHLKDDLEEAEIKYVNTQDYLYIDVTVIGEPNRAASDVPTSSGLIKEEHTDPDSAEILAEEEQIRESNLNKIEARHGTTSLKTEEEINADTRIIGTTDDVGVVGIITNEVWEEAFKSLELEMLKEQVASWRVILHRLPTVLPSTTTSDTKQEMIDIEETSAELIMEKKEELHLIDDLEEAEIKYVNTQDYLDIDETVVGEPNRAAPDVPTSSDMEKEMMDLEERTGELIMVKKEELYVKDALEEVEVKYVNTQDYLDIDKTVVGEPNRAVPDVPSSSDVLSKRANSVKADLQKHSSNKIHTIQACDCQSMKRNDFISKMCAEDHHKCDICKCCIQIGDSKTIHTSDTPYNCKVYDNECSWDATLKTLTGEKTFKCDFCGYECIQKGHMRRHIKTHTREKPYKCKFCEYQCARKDNLKSHIRTHTGEKPFKCDYCDYQCAWKNYMKSHIKTHTGETPFKCDYCDYQSAKKIHMKSHIQTHTGEKPFKCDYCDYQSANKTHMIRHIKTHTGEKPFKCDFCDYQCIQKNALKSHIKTHTREKPYKCKFCEYQCARKDNLKSHIQTHTGEKPFKCDYCDYQSAIKTHMIRHIKTHTGEKPFKCDFCDYQCIEKNTLKIHIRTHTREKPFKCDFCNYQCIVKNSLKIHIRTHTGEKPFKCSFCYFQSAKSGNLKRHIQTHTGEKPFKCDFCDYQCNRKSYMQRHLKKHTEK